MGMFRIFNANQKGHGQGVSIYHDKVFKLYIFGLLRIGGVRSNECPTECYEINGCVVAK